ncbi:MAG: LPS export ABC transporter permease LptG [Candidatus Omnitrophica bacterium CG1_02_49_10]|nr:MAG: LPS export ABC transporter permease LptG [Candidatus Omnitrophica bacterium CG1_02_49_10]
MRIIDRYIIKQFLPPLIYCITTFVMLYVMLDLFGHLDEILRQNVKFAVIMKYYIMFIPTIFVRTMPIAALISTVYVLSNMHRHNEITALRASGLSMWQILRPFIICGFLVSLIVFLVNDRYVPGASMESERIKSEEIEKGIKGKHRAIDDLAVYGSHNRLFYVKRFDVANDELQNIVILEDNPNQRLVAKVVAEKAKWKDGKWLFYNCVIYRLSRTGAVIGEPLFYEEKAIDIKESPSDFARYNSQADFMNYRELNEYIDKLSRGSGKAAAKLRVDLHYKVSFPFISFVIILIAIPFALKTRVRGATMIGMGMSIIIGFVYYAVMAISMALGKGGVLPPFISAWLSNIIFGVCGLVLIGRLK